MVEKYRVFIFYKTWRAREGLFGGFVGKCCCFFDFQTKSSCIVYAEGASWIQRVVGKVFSLVAAPWLTQQCSFAASASARCASCCVACAACKGIWIHFVLFFVFLFYGIIMNKDWFVIGLYKLYTVANECFSLIVTHSVVSIVHCYWLFASLKAGVLVKGELTENLLLCFNTHNL